MVFLHPSCVKIKGLRRFMKVTKIYVNVALLIQKMSCNKCIFGTEKDRS